METNLHEEETLGKSYDGRLMKRLISYLRPYLGHAFTAFIFLLITSVGTIAGPWLTQIAIDDYILPGDYNGLLNIVLIYIGILLAVFLFQYYHFYLMNMIGQKIMYDMRKEIYAHIQGRPLRFFDKNPIGRLVTRLTGDIDVLNEMFTSGVVAIFGDILLIIGIVSVMFYYNFQLALVALSVVPLLFFTAFLFKKKVREGFRTIRLLVARLNSILQENITGMKIVQLFNRESVNFAQFREVNREHTAAYIKTVLYYSIFFPTVEILSAVALALIIWFGGMEMINGGVTFGVLFMFIRLAQMFYRPIQDLSEKYNILQGAMASSERIFKLLDNHDSIPERPDAKTLENARGEIEFRDVSFAYDSRDWVLKNVSFSVKPGEKVAVVGATGSGKTTMVSLLSRFYDVQKGEILVDGHNIKDLKKTSLRGHIGIVLQDVFLFSGTIKDNITLGNKAISDEMMVQAAKDVNADTFIRKLENGYMEEVRERGNNFSTGQKQLISFSRALVYDPQILVLDEATSNIDTGTELLIQEALHRLMEGRTSIVVAHRLSTIKDVDRILVMHKGEITESGTHKELLDQKGIYYKLYQLQYKDQEN